MKEGQTDFIVLRCRKCRAENEDWELGNFMSQLGKEYEAQRTVLQYCGCVGENTEHVIVGTIRCISKRRTPSQVFAAWRRRPKKRR